MHSSLLLLVVVILAAFADGLKRRYDGDQVFRIQPKTGEHLRFIKSDHFINAPNDQYEFWHEPSTIGEFADIHVNVKWVERYKRLLATGQIPYTVAIEDVQRLIDSNNKKRAKFSTTTIVNTFPTTNETYQWLEQQCALHSNIASCGVIGRSYENRTINYIKIGANEKKPQIIIDATMHGREWLATATLISIINNMLTTYNSDPTTKRMVDDYVWILIPIANPDGYEYSHTRDRLWRKTRSMTSPLCYGVDLNRNWDSQWKATGPSPCSDTYAGSKPFSEIEAKTFAEFITANQDKTIAYFSLHTYSQLWLLPYGSGEKPSDYDEMFRVAVAGFQAVVGAGGNKWRTGNAGVIEGSNSNTGTSIDWVKNATNIKYSYRLKLSPSQRHLNGFIVEPSAIDKSFQEIWPGIVAAVDAMQK